MRRISQHSVLEILFIALVIIFILRIWFPEPFGNYCARTPPIPRPITDSSISIQHLWTRCTGITTFASGMIIYDGTIIFSDFYQKTLFSLDLQTGIQRWQIPIMIDYDLELDRKRQRIYAHKLYTKLGEIYAIDAKSGNLIWTNDDSGYKEGYRPILLANDVLIGLGIWGDVVRQLDIETGKFGPALAIQSNQVFQDGYGWSIRDGYLTAIDAMSGDIYWQAQEVAPTSCCLRAVQLSTTSVVAIFDSSFAIYNRLSHEIRWSNSDDHLVGHPTLTEAVVFTLDIQGMLRVLDIFDGSEIGYVIFEPPSPGHDSDSSTGDSISSSKLIADDDHLAIFFGDTDMLSIYEITLNPSLWPNPTGVPIAYPIVNWHNSHSPLN